MNFLNMFMIAVCCTAMMVIGSRLYAAKTPVYHLKCRFAEVIDGDTIKCAELKGIHPLFGKNVSVRIAGIEAPELNKTSAKERRLGYFVKAQLTKFINKQLPANAELELRNVKRGKYFRLLADVIVGGKELKLFLLKKRYACVYNNDRHGKLAPYIKGRRLKCPRVRRQQGS